MILGTYGGSYRAYRFDSGGGTPLGSWTAEGVPLYPIDDARPAAMEPDLLGGALFLSDRELAAGQRALYAQYLSNLGTPAPGWSSSGEPIRITNASPSSVQALLDGRGGFLVFWVDPNGGAPAIYGQRLGPDPPVPVALAFVDHSIESGVLHLRWYSALEAIGAGVVERRTSGTTTWSALGHAELDLPGYYSYSDPDIRPGEILEYRLSIPGLAGSIESDMVRIVIPGADPELSLAAGRQPSRAGDAIHFSLRDGETARLDVFDVRGRCTWSEHLAGLGPGAHVRVLGRNAFPSSGVFWVRLAQGTEVRTARIVFVE